MKYQTKQIPNKSRACRAGTYAAILPLLLGLAACSKKPAAASDTTAISAEQAAAIAKQSLEKPLSQYPAKYRPAVTATAVTPVAPGLYQVVLRVEAPLDSPALIAQNGGKPLQPGQNVFPVPRYVLQTSQGETLVSAGDLGALLKGDGYPVMPVLSKHAVDSLFVTTFGRADAPNRFLLFADVGCPYCHELLARIKPQLDAGTVRVDVAPAAIVTSAEENSVLRPTNQAQAFSCMTKPIELPQARQCGTNGSAEDIRAIQRNTEVFKFQAGLSGVPAPMVARNGVWELTTREVLLQAGK